MPKDKGSEWNAAIHDVHDCGFMTEPLEFGPEIFAVTPSKHGWCAVARELAQRLPGQLQVSPSGVLWQYGRESKGRLINVKARDKIITAREVVRYTVPQDDRGPLKWSVGGCARQLLEWAARPQGIDKAAEKLAITQYHDCEPGFYDTLTMLDVKACYFSIIDRLPSIRCKIREGKPAKFWDLDVEEADRWLQVKEACRNEKLLRNAMWGAMRGGNSGQLCYSRDKEKGIRSDGSWHVKTYRVYFGSGPFRSAAILTERIVAEVAAIASHQVGSVYSTVDSVTIAGERPTPPQIWQDLRLHHEIKAGTGPGHICGIGSWLIDGVPSGHYRRLRLGQRPVARYAIESCQHKCLLT